MISFARRSSYFDKENETYWMPVPDYYSYKEVKFIYWVFEINGKAYTHGSPEFKEEFNKIQMWRKLTK